MQSYQCDHGAVVCLLRGLSLVNVQGPKHCLNVKTWSMWESTLRLEPQGKELRLFSF